MIYAVWQQRTAQVTVQADALPLIGSLALDVTGPGGPYHNTITIVVPGGEARPFNLHFIPTATGTFLGTVKLFSQDGTETDHASMPPLLVADQGDGESGNAALTIAAAVAAVAVAAVAIGKKAL